MGSCVLSKVFLDVIKLVSAQLACALPIQVSRESYLPHMKIYLFLMIHDWLGLFGGTLINVIVQTG